MRNIFWFLLCRRGSTYGDVTQINDSTGAGTITTPSTAVTYSHSFKLKYGQVFGIWLKAVNGASQNANLKIQLEQGRAEPTTEGSADSNWVIADGVADIYTNLNDGATQLAHIKTVSPVPMKYGRLKITGLGSNPADSTLVAYLFSQAIVT